MFQRIAGQALAPGGARLFLRQERVGDCHHGLGLAHDFALAGAHAETRQAGLLGRGVGGEFGGRVVDAAGAVENAPGELDAVFNRAAVGIARQCAQGARCAHGKRAHRRHDANVLQGTCILEKLLLPGTGCLLAFGGDRDAFGRRIVRSHCVVAGGASLPHAHVEPLVFFRGQREQGFAKRALDRAQRVAAHALLFRVPVLGNEFQQAGFQRRERRGERFQRGVVDHAGARGRCQIEVRDIDDALQIAVGPGRFPEGVEFGERTQNARSRAVQADFVGRVGRIQIQLGIDVPGCGRCRRQVMQQIAGELARLDVEFLARVAIDHLDPHAGVTDALSQLRSQIPLYLLARNLPHAGQ